MPSQLTIPRTIINPGPPVTAGPLSIPDGDTLINMSIDRTIANGLNKSPTSAVLTLYVFQSGDGGATWTWIGGDQMTGGIYISPKTGLEEDTDYIEVNLNPGTSRQVRGQVQILGGGGSVAVSGTLTTT